MNKKNGKKILGFDIKEIIVDFIFYFLGGLCYASAVNFFNSPNNIAQGGATGVAMLVNYVLPKIPIGTALYIINIPLFIASFIKYGKKFIIKTGIATLFLSVIIDIENILVKKYDLAYTGDKLLAAIFGGALCGIGLGLVFSRGATTGGTDILGRLLHSKLQYISMGRLVMLMDIFVVVISGVVYKSIESMLYAVIVFFLSSKALDFVLYGSDKNKLLIVITQKPKEVSAVLRENIYHGVTILPVENTYDKKDRKMLMTAVHINEVIKVRKLINSVDDNPFIIITDSSEIRGQGFKSHSNTDDI